jgi:antitoxin MazE
MKTRIRKWGNSLGLRIPKAFAEEAGVADGSEVDLSIENGGLIVRPARPKKYRLRDLLRRVTARNVHEEIETGPALGREVW